MQNFINFKNFSVSKMSQTTAQVRINKTEIRSSPVLGRYLINGPKVIDSGDVLIEELPFVVGPKCCGPVVCLECFCFVNCGDSESGADRCPKCSWPLCVECQNSENSKYHANNECLIFSKAKIKFYNIFNEVNGCPQLDCITPLRYKQYFFFKFRN